MSVSQSTFRFFMQGYDPAPSPYLDGITHTKTIEKVLDHGDGASQINTVNAVDATLGAGATTSIDLKTANDAYGVALALDEIVAIYIENADDGAGGTVEVRPNGVNGFTNLLGAGSAVKLPKGCAVAFFLADMALVDKWLVTGANKVLDFVETGGVNSAHLIIQAWGRR